MKKNDNVLVIVNEDIPRPKFGEPFTVKGESGQEIELLVISRVIRDLPESMKDEKEFVEPFILVYSSDLTTPTVAVLERQSEWSIDIDWKDADFADIEIELFTPKALKLKYRT